MQLKRFSKDSDSKNIKYMLIAFAIILGAGIVFVVSKSHAFYKEENQYDIIKAKIGNWVSANGLIYDNSNSGSECEEVECALDDLYNKLK